MKFVSKAPITKTFWVEEFTEEDKEFFISLGFTDKEPHSSEMVAKAFQRVPTLYFVGSEIFGLWSQEEIATIIGAIRQRHPETNEIKIEKFYENNLVESI